MKRDDLFTKLHDEYNTFPSSIQDPEAFHHDVYEISNQAVSVNEFHDMMAHRKQQRLRELNDSLESAAVEIIANPSLMGTTQWQYALQLFRTKSLDSLVRYFASYLPDDHPWHRQSDTESTTSESASEGVESLTNSTTFFIDHDEKPIMTHEPLSISTASHVDSHLPPSPRSLTMRSDASAEDGDRCHAYIVDMPTPARTLSFSGSESERFDKAVVAGATAGSTTMAGDEEDSSQHADQDESIAITSELERLGSRDSGFVEVDDSSWCCVGGEADGSYSATLRTPTDADHHVIPTATATAAFGLDECTDESATPTPKPEHGLAVSSYLDLLRKSTRASSPSRISSGAATHRGSSTSHHDQHQQNHHHSDARRMSPRMRSRREGSPVQVRRSPGEPLTRIQKPLPDPLRCRHKERRRAEMVL
jgi:hypothetical protein